MAVLHLNDTSLQYVASFGYSTTDDDNWPAVFNIAWSNVTNALKSDPSTLDPKAASYVIDYMIDAEGMDTSMSDLMFGSATDPGEAFKASGMPLTDGLAAFFAPLWIRGSTSETQRNGDLYQILDNTLDANAPPPALAITTLGNSAAKIIDYGTNSITSSTFVYNDTAATPESPGVTNERIAQGFAQRYFYYALENHLAIPPSLIDAYVTLDPATAQARMAQFLEAGLSGTATDVPYWKDTKNATAPYNTVPPYGDDTEPITVDSPYVQTDLLAAYKQLGATTPATGTGTGGLVLDTSFEDPPPVLKGWDYFATWALQNSAEKKQPLDPSLLQQLDASNPWAGSYVRYEALKAQAPTGTLDDNLLSALKITRPDAALKVMVTAMGALVQQGKNLNQDYLKFVAARDPSTAQALCVASLEAALQPLNRLVNTTSPLSPAGDHITTSPTPTVIVSLASMGSPGPVAGDVVEIRSGTALLGNSSPLTATDIAAGHIEVKVGTLATPDGTATAGVLTVDGSTTNVYSDFKRTTTSTPSAAVTVNYTGETSFSLNLGANTAMAPAAGDVITVYADGLPVRSYGPLAANELNYLQVTPPSSPPFWSIGSSYAVTYTITRTATSTLSLALPVTAQAAAPLASDPGLSAPRPADPVAMTMLVQLNQTLAATWQAKFAANGYTGPGSTGEVKDDFVLPPGIPEAYKGAIQRVGSIDVQIKNYFDEVKRKTDDLNKINQLLAAANTALGQLPLNTGPTETLAGDDNLTAAQYSALVTSFNALAADMKLGFTITTTTRKSDLEGYVQTLKSSSDSLNNTNQLDLITIQGLSNQKQVMMNLVSTLMNSTFEAMMKVISKF